MYDQVFATTAQYFLDNYLWYSAALAVLYFIVGSFFSIFKH